MKVGAYLARSWQLPDKLVECIEFHHHPGQAREYNVDCSIIHIADALANLAELNSIELDDVPPISPYAWEVTGLSPDIVEPVIAEAWEQYEETQQILVAA
jgi:HD-like signal output (HDOD) protein